MSPERRVALREYRVMEAAQVVFSALLIFVVPAKLQHHQFSDRVQKIARIERPAFGFTSRRGFLEERLIAEETHPLLYGQILAVQSNGDDEARQSHQRFGKLSESDGHVAAPEAGLDHHLPAGVRPAFDERNGGEELRLADLRLDAPQVPEMQEVAGIDLVNRNVPERRDVEIPHVLFLPVGRPGAIDFGEVVVGAAWL